MRTDDRKQVVFAGGGTGGHLFPGLAVAEKLAAQWPHARITFAGTGKAWERRLVAAAGFDYLPLRCRQFPRRLGEALPFVWHNLKGYRSAARYLGWHRVAVVVGLGGYASAAMARAAARCGVPLVLLEQNVVPGRATRWLARSATIVCVAFEQTVGYLGDRCTVRVTGNPVREAILQRSLLALHGPHELASLGPASAGSLFADATKPDKRLLVLGGSTGARSLNQNVPQALRRIGRLLGGWKILHQSGEWEFEKTRRLYAASGLPAEVRPFLPDLPEVLGRSDLAVSRAGGTTLAELAAAGVPAVLLPYPLATDDHQRKNAEVFAAAGGAVLLDERQSGARLGQHLAAAIAALVGDHGRREAMSAAIRRRAYPDAAWDVATMIRHLAWN